MDPADRGSPRRRGRCRSVERPRPRMLFFDSTGDSPGRQKPKCGRLRGALTMQDEKRRRESCRQRTRSGVFLTIISLISRQHMLSAVRNGSHVSGGKLSEPRQSHRLQTRIAAFIVSRSHRYIAELARNVADAIQKQFRADFSFAKLSISF